MAGLRHTEMSAAVSRGKDYEPSYLYTSLDTSEATSTEFAAQYHDEPVRDDVWANLF
jgi:hypothetical protein